MWSVEASETYPPWRPCLPGYWQKRSADAAGQRLVLSETSRADAEGYHHIVGRAKDMIISGGENIYPAEVEAVLHDHPAVASAALIALPDPKWGEKPVAVIIKRQGDVATADDIINFCEGKLARYKIPRRVIFVEEFPLLASGKISKRLLKEEIEKKGIRDEG